MTFEKFSLLKYKIFTLIFGKIKSRKLERGYYGKRYINFIWRPWRGNIGPRSRFASSFEEKGIPFITTREIQAVIAEKIRQVILGSRPYYRMPRPSCCLYC